MTEKPRAADPAATGSASGGPAHTDSAGDKSAERVVIRDKRKIDPNADKGRSGRATGRAKVPGRPSGAKATAKAQAEASDPSTPVTGTEGTPAGLPDVSEPEVRTDPVATPEPAAAEQTPDAAPEAASDTGPEADLQPEAEAQPEAEPQLEAEAQPEAEPQLEVEVQPEVEVKPAPEGEVDQTGPATSETVLESETGVEEEERTDPRLAPPAGTHETPAVDEPAAPADTERAAPAGTEAGPLGAELEALRAELDERTRDLQRVSAEYANYRKRVDRDRSATAEQAIGTVLTALLPVLDDLDRAREHGDLVGPFGSVAEQVTVALSKFGLTAFGEKGEPFDPNRHEAVAHMTSAEVDGPTCVDVMRRGYLVGDRLLRAALVAVADPE